MTVAIEQIVDEVISWASPDDVEEFISTKKEDLIRYHNHSLGREIRNQFKLWTHTWEPEIINGVDMSPNHPDAVSMTIIERVWYKMRGEEYGT